MTWPQVVRFFAEEPRFRDLIPLCRAELSAEEIWLFGSRARGDHRPDSDRDILTFGFNWTFAAPARLLKSQLL